MARIGRDLGADWLIYGKIERRDTGYQVTIKLLNVESMNMARVTTEVISFADNTAPKISERGRFLFHRLTGIPEQGNLTIEANVDQGRVFVERAAGDHAARRQGAHRRPGRGQAPRGHRDRRPRTLRDHGGYQGR